MSQQRVGPINVEIVDYHSEATTARTPIYPGEHLADELKQLRISAAELARHIEVPVKSARDHGRHGAAARPLVRHQPGILAQSAKTV